MMLSAAKLFLLVNIVLHSVNSELLENGRDLILLKLSNGQFRLQVNFENQTFVYWFEKKSENVSIIFAEEDEKLSFLEESVSFYMTFFNIQIIV